MWEGRRVERDEQAGTSPAGHLPFSPGCACLTTPVWKGEVRGRSAGSHIRPLCSLFIKCVTVRLHVSTNTLILTSEEGKFQCMKPLCCPEVAGA